MKNLSDEGLIVLFAQGKNEAFDVLLARHQSKLLSYICMFVQDRDQAEDIFQDTFMKVIVTIKSGRYHENGKFLGYLYRIAHNLMIDYFRQEQNSLCVSDGEKDFDIFNNKHLCDPSLEEVMSREQIYHDVRRLIKYLPDSQREIIFMRYYRGMSFKEIAQVKKMSINTALGRMRYAILNIRKMAEEHNISLAV